MRLTHLADYAVVILSAAARRPHGERLSTTALASETGVPLPTAQKLMGRLATAGLLTSSRGQQGGFSLARCPTMISLADIVEAVEGPIAMTQCGGSEEASDCALDAHCRVKDHMGIVGQAVRGALDAVSLAHLSSPAKGTHQSNTLMGPKAGAQARAARAPGDPSAMPTWAPAFAGEQQ